MASNEGSILISCTTSLALSLIKPHDRLDHLPPEDNVISSSADKLKDESQLKVYMLVRKTKLKASNEKVSIVCSIQEQSSIICSNKEQFYDGCSMSGTGFSSHTGSSRSAVGSVSSSISESVSGVRRDVSLKVRFQQTLSQIGRLLGHLGVKGEIDQVLGCGEVSQVKEGLCCEYRVYADRPCDLG